jgi:glycosyltransferase involved in cell wall biosynthesis
MQRNRLRRRPGLRLFATDLAGGGGTEAVLRRQVGALQADWDIEVISSTMPVDFAETVSWRHIPVPRRPAWLKWSVYWALAGVVGLIRRRRAPTSVTWATGCIVPLRVDAITIHFCHAGYVQAIGGMSTGRHGWRRINAAVSRRLALAMEWWSLRANRVGSVLAVSPGVAAEVEAHYGSLPVTITPNGVAFPPPKARAAATSGPLRAIFVGGDWGRKGLDLVIRALADCPNALLVVVGGGSDSEGPAIARQAGVSRRVTFVGYRTDVGSFLDASDVLVLASAYEAMPLVVLEAAAHGVVPIVTAVNGVECVVDHEQSGLILRERSVAAVADALRLCDADRTALSRMSDAARKNASVFSWERSALGVSDALRSLT